MGERLQVGVVGCGLIAQVMHLPHLLELDDRYRVAALCDLSEEVVAACGERYGVERTFTDLEGLLGEQLDVLLILTGGSHAPAAIAAAEAGLHVLAEKPLALSAAEGRTMVDAARRHGVRLMVGNMKRYDPAFVRLREVLAETDDLRLARVTTLESPLQPYVAHRPLLRGSLPAGTAERLTAEDARSVREAMPRADDDTRWCYRWVVLDNLVHELNLLRGALGEPTRVDHAGLARNVVAVNLSFGDVACHLSWVDLPGIARYSQEFAFYSPHRRATLRFPSPFLPNMPTELALEGGVSGTARAWLTSETASYEEAFKRELIELHAAITGDRDPLTSGDDGLRDLQLGAAIVRSHLERRPIDDPVSPEHAEVLRSP